MVISQQQHSPKCRIFFSLWSVWAVSRSFSPPLQHCCVASTRNLLSKSYDNVDHCRLQRMLPYCFKSRRPQRMPQTCLTYRQQFILYRILLCNASKDYRNGRTIPYSGTFDVLELHMKLLTPICHLSNELSLHNVSEHHSNPSCGFEVFTAVTMKNDVFWDVTSCGSCKKRHFGGT
jgi:hypothetical protein